MKRHSKVALLFLLTGVVALGTISAQRTQGKPPALVPLAVTIYDEPNMLRSDTGGEYINGVDSVVATADPQYGELYFEVSSKSPRRVLLEFNNATKESCPNGCVGSDGNPVNPPGLGEVNSFIFSTYNRNAWSCESRFAIDCTRDFLHLVPYSWGHTNLRLQILSPKFSTCAIWLDYSRACADLTQIGYVFFEAGPDLNGDSYADEWDLYPVPPGYPFNGDMAHAWLLKPGGKKCDFGRYELPFRIHMEKI